MAQLHAHLWHTHPDVSPFVPLAAAQLSLHRMDFAGLPRAANTSMVEMAAPQRQPESMQIDSTAASVGAASSSSAAADESQPGSSAASTNASEAGPSGVAPGAPQDAQMTDPPARRAPRKHSDAPVRKLSVALIDTYKLINQVGSLAKRWEGQRDARRRGWRRHPRAAARATPRHRRERPSSACAPARTGCSR